MSKYVNKYHNHCPAMLQCDLEVSMRPTYYSNLLVYLSGVCSVHKYMEHQLALLIQSFFAVFSTGNAKDVNAPAFTKMSFLRLNCRHNLLLLCSRR